MSNEKQPQQQVPVVGEQSKQMPITDPVIAVFNLGKAVAQLEASLAAVQEALKQRDQVIAELQLKLKEANQNKDG